MGVRIEELRAHFTSNVSGYINGVRKVVSMTKAVGEEIAKVGRAANDSLNRVGLATTAMTAKAVKSFADFEATMKRAGAVTSTLGSKDFALLEEAARKMGETTVFSAAQAAEAIEQMGLAGLNTTEIVEALPGALQLASAAQVSIAQASDVAAKTMRAFGADASELSHINDVMVATFTRANTDLTQLAEAMKHVAPVSKGLGVSLEDTAAAIAKMSDAGFQGSMAGTALRNILSRMAGAVPEAASALRKAGVETTDASGKMRPFLDILSDIERAALTDAEILQIFGARGGPQLMSLLEVGSAGLRSFSQGLEESGGIAQRISDANLDTLHGQFMLLQSAIESVMIDLGSKLRPTMEDLFSTIQENRETLVQLANSFAQFVDQVVRFAIEHPNLVKAFALFKAGSLLGINNLIVTLTGSLGKMVAGLTKFAAGLKSGSTSASALRMAFVGLVAVGVAAWIANAAAGMEDLNNQLQKSIKLTQEMNDVGDKRVQQLTEEARRTGDTSALEAAIEAEEKNILGLQNSINGQRKLISQIEENRSLLVSAGRLVGLKDAADEERQNLENLESSLASARQRVEQMREAMQALKGDSSDAAQAVASGITDGVSAGASVFSVGDGSDAADIVRSAQLSAMDQEAAGTSRVIDLLGAGASPDQLREFLLAVGASSGLASSMAGELSGIQAGGGFQSQEQLDAFAMKVAETLQAQIEAEEKQRQMIEDRKAAIDQTRELAASLDERFRSLGDDAAAPLRERFTELMQALNDGSMSAAEYQSALRDLSAQTDEATAAAKRKEMQEQREAILRGDFSVLDARQALEDKLFQYRMQQFNQQIDQTFNSMMGLDQAVKPVTQQFERLEGLMQDFGQSIQVNAQQAQQTFGAISGFLNSAEGARASIIHNIQLLKQALTMITDVTRRREIEQQIAALEQQLASLNSAPIFTAVTGAFGPRDPGLASSNSVTVSLPNITRVTNDDVRALADAITVELGRRGARI